MNRTKLALIGSLFVGLAVVAMSATTQAQAETLPKRETFTFPAQLKGLTKGLVEAGINVVYGPNSVPPPQGISEEAKQAWAKLPQVPLQADDLE